MVNTPDEKPAESETAHAGTAAEVTRDAAFAVRARDLLLDSVESLDAKTRSRLARARHAALDQLDPSQDRRGFSMGGWLAPAGGLAAVLLVGLVWFGAAPTPGPAQQSAAVREATGTAVDDFALMADAENLELAEEIEFYSWLESEAALPAPGGGVG